MRIFVAGDVVGPAGLSIMEAWLPKLRAAWSVDVAVVNGENAAYEGRGITPMAARRLFAAGADVITGGNHSLRCQEIVPYMARTPRLLMPANWPEGEPAGCCTVPLPDGRQLLVVQVQGQAFMPGKCRCPFAALDDVLIRHGRSPGHALSGHPTLVDVHAEASSEKQALAWHAAGRVSAVVGTHTHVPTADARLLAGTTAYQTDLGMCGPYDSVIGFDADAAIERFISKERITLDVARDSDVRLCGALIDIAADSAHATHIQSVQWPPPCMLPTALPPLR